VPNRAAPGRRGVRPRKRRQLPRRSPSALIASDVAASLASPPARPLS